MIDRCDNHYTTNTSCAYGWLKKDTIKFNFNYASLYAKAQKQKNTYFFSIFCNIPNVICSHLPFVSIYYNVTLFIFEYVHKIISDPPLVISPPLCIGTFLSPENYIQLGQNRCPVKFPKNSERILPHCVFRSIFYACVVKGDFFFYLYSMCQLGWHTVDFYLLFRLELFLLFSRNRQALVFTILLLCDKCTKVHFTKIQDQVGENQVVAFPMFSF